MGDIAAEPDERVRVFGGSRETVEMADCVAGCVEEIKGAITEVVEGGKFANLERSFACASNFAESSAPDSFVSSGNILNILRDLTHS